MKRLILFLTILLSWTLSGSAQITSIGSEFRVTPSLASAYGQHHPKVAYDGTSTYLVVWEQGANTPNTTPLVKQIYLARFQMQSGSPVVLDQSGIQLSASSYSQELPKVTYDSYDNTFLVVWQERNSSGDYDIKAATLTPSSSTPSSVIQICSQPHNQIMPNLAYDSINHRFFIVWADLRNYTTQGEKNESSTNYQIYYNTYTPSAGTPLGSSAMLVGINTGLIRHYSFTESYFAQFAPAIVINNSATMLLVFSEANTNFYTYADQMALLYSIASNGTLSIVTKPIGGYNYGNSFTKVLTSGASNPVINEAMTDGTNFMWTFRDSIRGGHADQTYFSVAYAASTTGDDALPYNSLPVADNRTAPSAAAVYVAPYYYTFWEGFPNDVLSYSALGPVDHVLRYNYVKNPSITLAAPVLAGSPITLWTTSGRSITNPAVATDGASIILVYEEDDTCGTSIGSCTASNQGWHLMARLLSTETPFLTYDEPGSSGTTWTGWTYKPNGASNSSGTYYNPGWWKNDGFDSSGNWIPRSHGMGTLGSDSLAEIYTSDRAPSTTTGNSLRVYDSPIARSYQSGWWLWLGDKAFYQRGFTRAGTNRLSFYIKPTGSGTFTANGDPQSVPNSIIQVGAYMCWGAACPAEGPGNQHYYHYLITRPGTWYHVVLDQHPSLRRDTTFGPNQNGNNPRWNDSGRNYFENMASLYYQFNSNVGPTDVRVDDFKFYNKPNENDESIASVAIGYFKDTDTWEISWQDPSQYDLVADSINSTYEVRYSTSPITNENWTSATAITSILYGIPGSPGLVRKPQGSVRSCFTQFQLPDNVESANQVIFFAIKDVSVLHAHTGASPYTSGDWHNAPSSLIHTIDYPIGKMR